VFSLVSTIHTFFINGFYTLAFHTSAKEMFYVLFHFKPIKYPPYNHSCGLVSMMPCHGHIMLLLHDSLLAHRFGTTSISIVFPLRSCLSPFFDLAIFLSIFRQKDLTHRPCLSSVQGYFPPWRWPLVPKSSLGVFPLRNPPFDSTHQNLHCLDLVCELIPHLAMPRHFSYFTKALGWISKYFKEMLSLNFFVLCILK
jgi:hypothetical protein